MIPTNPIPSDLSTLADRLPSTARGLRAPAPRWPWWSSVESARLPPSSWWLSPPLYPKYGHTVHRRQREELARGATAVAGDW